MKQLTVRYSISTFCLLAFCCILTACGGSVGSSSSTTSAPTAAATLAPTPTPFPTPTVNLTTITGDGYTIGYPTNWISKKNSNSAITTLALTRDTSGSTSMIVETVASPTIVSTTGSIQGALAAAKGQAKNFQTKNVPTTVTINGTSWDQGAATFDDPSTGTNSTLYILSTKFPGNANKLISIIYTAQTSEFDKVNAEDFQPMLLSFKFA